MSQRHRRSSILASLLAALLAIPFVPASPAFAAGDTTTTLGAAPSSAVFGQVVTLTATVAGAGPETPTGSVEFFDGATSLGTSALNGAAEATLPWSASAAGIHSLTAVYPGDGTFNPSTSSPATLITIGKADQAALAVIATSPAAFGSSQTLSTSGGSGSGAVTYSDGSSTACSVSGSTLSITAGSGTCSVTATKAGDADYNPETSPAKLITIGKADQAALAVIATSPAAFGSSQTLSTSGGSGSGAVTYSDGSSTACSVSGSTLSITAGSGTCSVTATKAGDADYNPETSPAKLITIGKADQAALAVIATSPAAFGSSQTLSTSGGSGSGAVTYSDGSSTACSVSGSTLSITAGSGTCSVTATKAGDADYNPETSPAKLITIGKADQAALAVIATSPAAFGSSQTLSTSGGSGSGAVTYSDGSSTACSVSGSTLSITAGSGTCSVTATKAGDARLQPRDLAGQADHDRQGRPGGPRGHRDQPGRLRLEPDAEHERRQREWCRHLQRRQLDGLQREREHPLDHGRQRDLLGHRHQGRRC